MRIDDTAERARPDARLTLTEQARRAQLIGVTIGLVARLGHAGTSLARIAEAAGISKATVLYHFPSKDSVVRAAYAHVLGGLTEHVRAAVEPESGVAALDAYIRALVGHLRNNPDHARMIIAGITADPGITDHPHSPSRREAVAELVAAAGGGRPGADDRVTAVIVNGALDAIVGEQLADPGFDTAAAAEQLIDLVHHIVRR